VRLARKLQIPVTHLPPSALKRITQVATHQGVALELAAAVTLTEADLDPLLEEPGLLLYLDRIQDPHNLGAILRSALAFGVQAVLIPKRKAVGLTNTVVKVSQGAALKIPVVKIDRSQALLKDLQNRGYRLYGLDSDGTVSLSEAVFPDRTVLVMGSEGKGLSTALKNLCDTIVAIPMPGGFESLNVSVSTAIVLYEYRRQRIEVE
jgi:23S rRNA (guanosine2251-2'-O)-methyltransferase